MQLPIKKLNILGDRYSVHKRKQKAFGYCYYVTGKMFLRPNQSTDQARDTLLHEAIHAIDNVDSLGMTEEQVRRIATGLRAVFTSNPEFARWVSK